ncbi:hypothetical protein, partial [Actinomadura napierensis]|uniref:hypothetical protein n=1 Tax=Actinomadura napierensis TaxID=267854 RepID=UPI0031D3E89E
MTPPAERSAVHDEEAGTGRGGEDSAKPATGSTMPEKPDKVAPGAEQAAGDEAPGRAAAPSARAAPA